MKKLLVGISLVAAATGAAALAADHAGGHQHMNATVTRAQAEAGAAQMFARMDANKDGRIDAADREARHASMFDRLDANKDGQISRQEFDAHHAARTATRAERGAGDRAEGERGHRMGGRHMGGHKDGMGGGMMGMADANKDGAVTQAEATAAALARFDRMDANKDGQVTPEERRAARASMRQSRSSGPGAS